MKTNMMFTVCLYFLDTCLVQRTVSSSSNVSTSSIISTNSHSSGTSSKSNESSVIISLSSSKFCHEKHDDKNVVCCMVSSAANAFQLETRPTIGARLMTYCMSISVTFHDVSCCSRCVRQGLSLL
jgi:hypothetical protein